MASEGWVSDNSMLDTDADPESEKPDTRNSQTKSQGQIQSLPQVKNRKQAKVKRKANASPLDKPATVKRVNSEPTLSEPKSKSVPFSDLILHAFEDDNFVSSFKPVIQTMMTTVVTEVVNEVVQNAVKTSVKQLKEDVIDELIDANKSLQTTLSKQMELIDTQKSLIDKQALELNERNETVSDLQAQVKFLQTEVDRVSLDMNHLEQYGRRNSLRISNFAYDKDKNMSEPVLTADVVGFLNDKVLPETSKILTSDVERCHPVGLPNTKGYRQILIKFTSYQIKQLVYSNKKSLKNNLNGTFISEDLTRFNHNLVKSLSGLKKDKKINSYWTMNGRIFVKKDADDDPCKILTHDDIRGVEY